MAKISGSKCKLCRRAGEKLFLKGDRCVSTKCAIVKKPYAPGMHAKEQGRRGVSEYGKQLSQKQKAKRVYGISEQQLRKHFQESKKGKGLLGDNLVARLEMRLDNVVFQLKFAATRALARQLVSHGHFLVNGKKCNIPSRLIKIGDTVSLKKIKAEKAYFKNLKMILKKDSDVPGWLLLDTDKMEGKIQAKPDKHAMEKTIDTQSIIEFYSR